MPTADGHRAAPLEAAPSWPGFPREPPSKPGAASGRIVHHIRFPAQGEAGLDPAGRAPAAKPRRWRRCPRTSVHCVSRLGRHIAGRWTARTGTDRRLLGSPPNNRRLHDDCTDPHAHDRELGWPRPAHRRRRAGRRGVPGPLPGSPRPAPSLHRPLPQSGSGGASLARIGGASVGAPCRSPMAERMLGSGPSWAVEMWANCSASIFSMPPGIAKARTWT